MLITEKFPIDRYIETDKIKSKIDPSYDITSKSYVVCPNCRTRFTISSIKLGTTCNCGAELSFSINKIDYVSTVTHIICTIDDSKIINKPYLT